MKMKMEMENRNLIQVRNVYFYYPVLLELYD